MSLNVSGKPLHTRSLTVSTFQGEESKSTLAAAVIDLRKCGFVPVAGMLQASGIVHHMTLDGVLDSKTRILESFHGAQPTPAFEPSAMTRGECCRDPLDRLAVLRGRKLDDTFAGALRNAFGGNLGCSHLLNLAQLVASGVVTSLDWDAAQPPDLLRRREGERSFHRSVEIDGFEQKGGIMQIAVQFSDLYFRAAPEIAAPMDRFAEQYEACVQVSLDMKQATAITDIRAWERRRSYDGIESATWRDRSDELSELMGQRVMSGMSRRLLDLYGGDASDRPFLDMLLCLAPGFIQCIASLSESWPAQAKANPSLLGVMGRADSCYMWRDGGALLETALSEDSKAAEIGSGSRGRSGSTSG